MTDERSGPTPDHEAHLDRNRRVWDRWSDHYALSESDFQPMREAAMARLGLRPGDRVLDIGCGPGVNVEFLRERVGPSGEVVAVDYSPKMVEKARARVAENGWENVTVVRADATTADLGDGFDAAVATLSLSVMPDPRLAVENVHASLDPGATVAVFDVGTIPDGPLRVLNPVLSRALRLVANWNPDGDVEGAIRDVFDRVEPIERQFAGTTFTAIAHRSTAAADPTDDAESA